MCTSIHAIKNRIFHEKVIPENIPELLLNIIETSLFDTEIFQNVEFRRDMYFFGWWISALAWDFLDLRCVFYRPKLAP